MVAKRCAVPRQNSIHAENGSIVSPSQREKSNSTKDCFEQREASSVHALQRTGVKEPIVTYIV
jgi:hypothetical protein